ncbi:hypothetical protein [Spirochaeta cellobiosiphila]|uniref:hypothetical protein n=1 Tax=Spirochaeta cellobiosiphila TaxID=504483 RepID=UPI0004216F69|nr:hypothetical protein [Spirochaeta cellobiosiphila]
MVRLTSLVNISRALHYRSIHRDNSESPFAVVGIFLLFILVVRTGSDLLMVKGMSTGTASIDYLQISNGLLTYIVLWGLFSGTLHLLRLLQSIPEDAFVHFTSQGLGFRKVYKRQILLRYPVHSICVLLILSVPFLVPSGDILYGTLFSLLIIGFMILAILVIARLPKNLIPRSVDIEHLQIFFLLLLVGLNPDVGNVHNKVVLLCQGKFISFGWAAPLLAVPVFILLVTMCLIFMSLLNRGKGVRTYSPQWPVLVRWYLRITGKIWFLMYLFGIPFILSDYVDVFLKKMITIIALVLSFLSFMIFRGLASGEIYKLWHRVSFDSKHKNLWIPVIVMAIILGIVPTVLYRYTLS